MSEYDKLYDFTNLYNSHCIARRGKRMKAETIEFESDLAFMLTNLSETIRDRSYQIGGYYEFTVRDPKVRRIHALHYADRVVQHCLCDNILAPRLDRLLIYDNAACRIGKGTHFAIRRVNGFLSEHFRKFGSDGWFLKIDVRKFFDSIDHAVLKEKLRRVFVADADLLSFLYMIIDSYESTPGKGLPLGNQSSQWFALYYLDRIDRIIKEQFQIRAYSRYMDDMILIHPEKSVLKKCLTELRRIANEELKLEFNEKTQIFPIRAGVNYLGFHFYLTETGKIVRKVRVQTKRRFERRLKYFRKTYAKNGIELKAIQQVLNSYRAHFHHGHCYRYLAKSLQNFVLTRKS